MTLTPLGGGYAAPVTDGGFVTVRPFELGWRYEFHPGDKPPIPTWREEADLSYYATATEAQNAARERYGDRLGDFQPVPDGRDAVEWGKTLERTSVD